MSSIVTSKYRTDDAELFLDNVNSNNYYLFVSTLDRYDVNNSEYYKNEFLEKTIFGKKIKSTDMFYMITNNRWQENTIYAQYDDREDMSTKNFYMVIYPEVEGVGDYVIYKCLSNNYGSASTVKPVYDENINDQVYITGDGYSWKYMYKISDAEFNKYFVSGYIPVIRDFSANTAPDTAKNLSTIIIENNLTNQGYSYKTGSISEVITTNSVKLTVSGSGVKGLNQSTNYYKDQYLYVTNNDTGYSALYKIYSYNYSAGSGIFVYDEVSVPPQFTMVIGNSIQIFPQISITGDGTGAIAIPTMEKIANTLINEDDIFRISRIDMLNRGTNYTNVKASVIDPLQEFDPTATNTNDERAILRPILSPIGGHGTNPEEELLSRHILVYSGIGPSDNLEFATTNTYTRIGIVKNPEFNTANSTITDIFDNRLELDVGTNYLSAGDLVTQIAGTEIFFQAEVHEVANSTIYLTDFNGPYQNSSNTEFIDMSLNPTYPLISPQGQQISINNIIRPNYVQKTGDVYYMTSFAPITRTTDSHEEYKIILEF